MEYIIDTEMDDTFPFPSILQKLNQIIWDEHCHLELVTSAGARVFVVETRKLNYSIHSFCFFALNNWIVRTLMSFIFTVYGTYLLVILQKKEYPLFKSD